MYILRGVTCVGIAALQLYYFCGVQDVIMMFIVHRRSRSLAGCPQWSDSCTHASACRNRSLLRSPQQKPQRRLCQRPPRCSRMWAAPHLCSRTVSGTGTAALASGPPDVPQNRRRHKVTANLLPRCSILPVLCLCCILIPPHHAATTTGAIIRASTCLMRA
jgi:hypothetical protein